jgi:predicted secreted protein
MRKRQRVKPGTFATTFAVAFLSIAEAHAGDVADLDILGFSQDGSVFAFEEYGVQDGSGFPYSNRYYIDTAMDRFLPGTPVRVLLDDEAATLDAARAQAAERGEKIVKQAELSANRGFTAGSNAVTELSADPFRMVVNPRPIFPPVDPVLEFRLEELPLSAPEPCASHGETRGFRLVRIDARDGGTTRAIHQDTSIPKSRGCPNGYGLGAIQTFAGQGTLTSYAVLISVRQYGFEGPDYRWIAVTDRF